MTTVAGHIWLGLTGPSYTYLRLMTTFVHVRCLSRMIPYSSVVLPPQLCCSPVHIRAYAPRCCGPVTDSLTEENQYLQHLHIIINRSDQTFNFYAKILQTWRRERWTQVAWVKRWCNVLYLAWIQNSGAAEVGCKWHRHYIYATIDFVYIYACMYYRIKPGWQAGKLVGRTLPQAQ